MITFPKAIHLITINYKDKIKGFYTARKEAGETQNHLRELEGKAYLNPKTSQSWIEGYEEVMRGINGYVNYIRNKRGAKR